MISSTNLSKSRHISLELINVIGVVALIAYLLMIGIRTDETQSTFTTVKSNFHVYCPINNTSQGDQNSSNQSKIYVVYIQSQNVTSMTYNTVTKTHENTTDVGLFYCGLARTWDGSCSNSQLICSAPGPMFYLPVGEEVTIIWINNITKEGMALASQGCYNSNSIDSDCMIDAKFTDYSQPQTQGCTFNKPTNYSFTTRKVRVNKNQVPISTHIHGIQTRPSFDGSPLSWFNNVGDRGVGYFSLNDTLYYSLFSKQDKLGLIPTFSEKLNMKIARFSNKQPAGNLFYHDHAMKSTKFNVAHGLSGLYILYNETAEQYLPKNNEEKFILFSHSNDGDLRDAFQSSQPTKSKLHTDQIFTLNVGSDTYYRNMTYRFRILNAHFDNYYSDLTFAVYYKVVTLPNGKEQIVQLSPFDNNFSFTDDLVKVNFTIIGTDSTLFNNPVHNINGIDMGSGQRVDIVIKFGPQNGIPLVVKNVYLICYDNNNGEYVVKYSFNLSNSLMNNKYDDPQSTRPLNVSFYNLSTISKSQIAANRMRPLFNIPFEGRFVINGHYMLNMGQTDNPKIGTVEDWFFINNLFEPHPIHFHLVNFQVYQQFSLKKIPQGCTLYELDFFRFSNYSSFGNLTNSQLCSYLGNITLDESNKLYEFLSAYNLQNVFTETNLGKVSGINVLDSISTIEDGEKYGQYSECPLNSLYKYVCKDLTDLIPSWYKRWKETALVRQYSVMVLRVRWASVNFDQKVKPYPYFTVPEDQLMEFPGFVYHCHILPHEDNEMMRPYMLTPSDYYIQQSNNSDSSKFWQVKAKQINTILNCQN